MLYMDELLLRVKVAAHILGIDPRTVRKLCEQGRIPAVDVSSAVGNNHHVWRIPISYVEDAISGSARWKYPHKVKRRTWLKTTARNMIAAKLKEVESMDRNEIRWSNDEGEDDA